MTPQRATQGGNTLLIGLIMLLLITILAVVSFKLVKGNLQVAGNMQQRTQTFSAAQGAIEQVLSSSVFTTTPSSVITNPCNGVSNTLCYDVSGRGVSDVTVTVTPTCVSTQVIPVTALNVTNPEDAGCILGGGQSFGTAGAGNNNSMCANALWDIQADATDSLNNAKYTVHEGVAVHVDANATCP